MTALVIAEHDHASIKGATLNTITAALNTIVATALNTIITAAVNTIVRSDVGVSRSGGGGGGGVTLSTVRNASKQKKV